MDTLSMLAASGMKARLDALDVLANNLANTGTAGFKADREFYNLYIAPEALEDDGRAPSMLPVVERNWTDFSQGSLSNTAEQLDFGLGGRGFFAVDTPQGPVYTRNGRFRIGPNTELQTQEGHAVRAQGGGRIRLDARQPVSVSTSGVVSQGQVVAGRLELVDFGETAALEKSAASYFRLSDPAVTAKPASAAVYQGRLEGSNVASAETAVRLIDVMRQFEMLQRAVSLASEMNRRSVEEVARPGS